MTDLELPLLLVVLLNATVLVLGVIVTHLAVRAYRRTGDRDLEYLAVGFGLVTLGLLFGGGVHAIVGDVTIGIAVRSGLTALGFGIVLYSLWQNHAERVYTNESSHPND